MDVTHRLVLTASYQLPIGRGKAIGNSWGKPLDMLAGRLGSERTHDVQLRLSAE